MGRRLLVPSLVALMIAACSSSETTSSSGTSGGTSTGTDGGASSSTAPVATTPGTTAVDGGLGAPELTGQDPASNGATITFTSIGKAGSYPSRRDPAAGGCDAFHSSTCCLATKTITSDALTADGCGQFNVFETVNDNNSHGNLDVFSTDMIGYAGYVGEGPCGPSCDASKLGAAVDLIDTEAVAGATSSPTKGPGAAFRRPEEGYRYFFIMLDVASRTVQLAIVHPSNIPTSLAPLLPAMPATVDAATVDAVRNLRLPS